MKTTGKQIEILIARLCAVSGEFNNREAAKAADKSYFITYEDAPVYGGCRLIAIKTEGGGHLGCFGFSSTEARVKKSEFYNVLTALIRGIEYGQGKLNNA